MLRPRRTERRRAPHPPNDAPGLTRTSRIEVAIHLAHDDRAFRDRRFVAIEARVGHERGMLQGLVAVVVFDLAGEAAARTFHLPLPGPVVGMVLLVIALLVRDDLASRFERGAGLLLRNLSLFFIPAGLGIVAEGDMLRTEWLPISVAIAVSTLLALLAASFAFVLAARGLPKR